MSSSEAEPASEGPEDAERVAELVERYQDTILHIADHFSVDLRVPLSPPLLEELARHGPAQRFAVITAFNPGEKYAHAENLRRHRELRRRVKATNAVWVPASGCSPDRSHCEDGVAVALPKGAAVRVAREFGQDAIFWYEDNTFFLIGACISFEPVRLPPSEPTLQ